MTGLLTGIARYLRNMYQTMAKMEQVDISYLAGKKLFHSMPPSLIQANGKKQLPLSGNYRILLFLVCGLFTG